MKERISKSTRYSEQAINTHVHAEQGISSVWTAAIVAGLAVVLTGAIAYTSVEAAPAAPRQTLTSLAGEVQKINQRLDRIEAMLKKNFSTTPPKETPSCADACKTAGGSDQTINACLSRCPAPTTTFSGGSCRDQCKQKVEGSFVGSASDTQKRIDQCIKETCAPSESTGSTTGSAPTAPASTSPTASVTACLKKCGEQADSCLKEAGETLSLQEACVKINIACRDVCKAPATTTAP